MVCKRKNNPKKRTFFRRTDDMNVKVEGFISQETMVNGRGDKEKVLLFILGRRSW